MCTSRAFARVDLVAVLTMVAFAACFLAVSASQGRSSARRLTDSDQFRLIVQGMAVGALANQDDYLLPSQLDAQNRTTPLLGESKNITGHWLSMLIFNGQIRPQQCVSPAEANPAQVVSVEQQYEYVRPRFAVNPAEALWDPAFSGTPFDTVGIRHTPLLSNQSYAPLLYFGVKRSVRWRNRGDAPTALIANRGPTYQGTVQPAGGEWSLTPGPTGTLSTTLFTYGSPTAWEGFAAYDDGTAVFHTTPNPNRSTYTQVGDPPTAVADNLFVDETDETPGSTGDLRFRSNLVMRPIARVTIGSSSFQVNTWID